METQSVRRHGILAQIVTSTILTQPCQNFKTFLWSLKMFGNIPLYKSTRNYKNIPMKIFDIFSHKTDNMKSKDNNLEINHEIGISYHILENILESNQAVTRQFRHL